MRTLSHACLAFGAAGCFLLYGATPVAIYDIRTLAGTSYTGDGKAASAGILVQPEGVAIDIKGNTYIADPGDHRVRKIDSAGRISTVAGVGFAGSIGDGGPAAAAHLNAPYDVCVDAAGNLYIADLGNGRVRKITPDGIISTFAGGGTADPDLNSARPATSVKLAQPRNVAIDPRGTLFISDFGAHRIYQVTADGNLSIVAGTGEAGTFEDGVSAQRAKLSSPAGIAIDAFGNLYVADAGNRRVRRINGQSINTVRDSTGRPIEFTTPTGVAVDLNGKLYVADGDILITISTRAELGFVTLPAKAVTIDASGRVVLIIGRQAARLENASLAIVAGTGSGGFAGDGRPAAEWRFTGPAGIARDLSGNLYIADSGNGRVRRIDAGGNLTTIVNGSTRPTALAVDSMGRLFIADALTGFIHRHDGSAAQLFSKGSESNPFKRPSALAFDTAGNLLVADAGNNLIRKISPEGAVSIVAGGGGLVDDTHPLRLKLAEPAGVAADAQGNIWFTEAGSGLIRKLDKSGQITTMKIDLKEPRGIKVDGAGNAYVCDAATRRVYRISVDAQWWPIAGTGEPGLPKSEGPALEAPLVTPLDLWLDSDGRILIVDAGSGRIHELVQTKEPAPISEPRETELRVLHAAAPQVRTFAPGQLVILGGTDIAGMHPADVKASLDGKPATVLSVEGNEIIALLPAEIKANTAELKVIAAGSSRASAQLLIAPSAPGLFTAATNPSQALALNEDGTLNGINNPAERGSIVTLFGTGHGGGTPETSAYIDGVLAEILYAGSAPGQPGVFQVNVRAPSGFAPAGVKGLAILMNGVSTQSGVTIVTR